MIRPRKPLAAVLFDLDGTLADTAPDLAAALNRVRGERGLAPVDPASLRPYASSGARGLLGAGMDVTPEHPEFIVLRDSFLRHYEDTLALESRLFDGIEALLDGLDARNLKWGVVTNKAERYTRPVLAALGLDRRSAVIVCGDTTPHPKPHPAPMFHAAKALGIPPERCAYVGDDLRDIQAGNAAGMPTLAACWGYIGLGGNPAGWPATACVDTPGEVLEWVGRDRRLEAGG
jgi:2-phosphoglycolate phosphatase